MRRRTLLFGLVAAVGLASAAFLLHQRSKNPGHWGASRIAAYVAETAGMDDVTLTRVADGEYEGVAENSEGRYDASVVQGDYGFHFTLRHVTEPVGSVGEYVYDPETGTYSSATRTTYVE